MVALGAEVEVGRGAASARWARARTSGGGGSGGGAFPFWNSRPPLFFGPFSRAGSGWKRMVKGERALGRMRLWMGSFVGKSGRTAGRLGLMDLFEGAEEPAL